MKRSVIFGLGIAFSFIPYLCSQALGQSQYPKKPVDIIVPFNPGGGVDITARLLSNYFAKTLKIQLNVINKPGGGGVIGAREVLTAHPDGYTMLAEGHGTSSMLCAFFTGKLPFDWRKRSWCGRITKDPVIYQVRNDTPQQYFSPN